METKEKKERIVLPEETQVAMKEHLSLFKKMLANIAGPKQQIYVINMMTTKMFRLFAASVKNYIIKLPKTTIDNVIKIYYRIQKLRIAANNASVTPKFKDEPKGGETAEQKLHRLGYDDPETQEALELIKYPTMYLVGIENFIRSAMEVYTDHFMITIWLKKYVYGIGPVLAANLYSALDIHLAPTTGHFLSYGGWTGKESKKVRGEKLKYNPDVRVLFWKIGGCFAKTCNNPKSFFGVLFKYYFQLFIINNETGKYIERAAIEKKKLEEAKDQGPGKGVHSASYPVYCNGKLTRAHLAKMAIRTTVARFLSIFHDKWYILEFDQQPPKPYVEAFLNHVDIFSYDLVEKVSTGEVVHPYIKQLAKLNEQARHVGAEVIAFGKVSDREKTIIDEVNSEFNTDDEIE